MTLAAVSQEMITIVESVCLGLEHTPFNAAMVEVVARAFPERVIRVVGDDQHLSEIRNCVVPDINHQINWQTVKLPDRRCAFIDRVIWTTQLLRMLTRREAKDSQHFLMLTALPATIYACKLVKLSRPRAASYQCVLHSIAADLGGWRSRNPYIRIQDLKSAMGMPPRCIQYLALERSIQDAIASRGRVPRSGVRVVSPDQAGLVLS